MSDIVKVSLTDVVIDAARITADVYASNVKRLCNSKSGVAPHVIVNEMRRAALMDELSKDDNLCEMLAGRLHQFGART